MDSFPTILVLTPASKTQYETHKYEGALKYHDIFKFLKEFASEEKNKRTKKDIKEGEDNPLDEIKVPEMKIRKYEREILEQEKIVIVLIHDLKGDELETAILPFKLIARKYGY